MVKKSTFSLIALLAGCSLLVACNKYIAETDKKIETTLERVEDYNQRAQIPDMPEPTDTVRMQNDIWLGSESVKIMEGEALPSWLEKEDGITIAIAENATLPDVVQQISDLTNIPVRIDDLKTAESSEEQPTVPVRYSGKLSGLLNYLAGRYGVYWQYRDKMISFFANETRVFTIYALPTETTLQASLTGATMGENSGGGNASSNLSTSANLSLWESIEEGVKQVAGEGAKLSFSRVTGTISVTASPYIIRKVGQYVAQWNEKLSRQVAITIRILEVDLSNSDNYGLNLAAAFNNGKFSLTSAGPYELHAPGTGVAAGAISTVGNLMMSIVRPRSKFKGTESIIQAFSSQGKTRQVTSASVTTMNNKVAPVQITTSKNYVKEVNVTTSGSGDDKSVETDMDTDTLTYGFTMDVLPRILDHGRLIMMFSMTMTNLVRMTEYSSASGEVPDVKKAEESADGSSSSDSSSSNSEETRVQLPTMNMRGFMQEVAMRSGSTLVLTGFEQMTDTTESSGIGKAKMGLLGGRAYSSNERQVMVILITPEVLQSPLSQEALMRDY